MSARLQKSTSPVNTDQNNPWVTATPEQQHLFTKSDHASRTISKVFAFLRQDFLCDVVFICHYGQSKRRITAHRLILSTLSDKFRRLFEKNTQIEIVVEDIDPDVLEKIINYAYEGSLDIHCNNATTILHVAHRFNIVEIVQVCARFLERQLNPNNCLSLYKLVLKHNLADLARNIWNYILEHFSEVIDSNTEFVQLSFEEIQRLLASDDINVRCEEKVFEAFCTWLDHDINRRNDRLGELFGLIRLPLLDRKYLTDHVDNNERFNDDRSCQLLIFETMRYHLAPEKRSTMQSIRTKPRRSTLGSLYCLGGSENSRGSLTIERYDFRTHCWRVEDSINSRRSQFACIRLEEKLYLCGGRDGLKTLNSVEIYDIPTHSWTIGSPMLTNRHDLAVGCITGPLYALGGHDGRSYLNTVERYDPETSTWSFVSSMVYSRCAFGVASLEQRLYAIGGRDGTTGLREVEFFDPHTNRWILCASMHKRRGGVAAASCNGYLYAVGGHDLLRGNKNAVRHDDGERYDPKSNQWTLITSFSRPKEALGISVVRNRLYIVGGFDGKALDEMECYNVDTEQWKMCSASGTKRDGPCLIHVPNSIFNNNTPKERINITNDRSFGRLILS